MINTNPLPKNARISVLVMVPTMSRPMFMPEWKSSLPLRSGATVCTSVNAEEMLMATSITAPRALMTTPATSRPRRPYYHLRIFLTVDPREQLRRIEARSGPEKLRQFIDRWIPLEEQYFQACSLAERCDFFLGV